MVRNHWKENHINTSNAAVFTKEKEVTIRLGFVFSLVVTLLTVFRRYSRRWKNSVATPLKEMYMRLSSILFEKSVGSLLSGQKLH